MFEVVRKIAEPTLLWKYDFFYLVHSLIDKSNAEIAGRVLHRVA